MATMTTLEPVVVFKVGLDHALHRFGLPRARVALGTVRQLVEQLLYQQLKDRHYTLTYTDDEGDLCTVESHLEFVEMLRQWPNRVRMSVRLGHKLASTREPHVVTSVTPTTTVDAPTASTTTATATNTAASLAAPSATPADAPTVTPDKDFVAGACLAMAVANARVMNAPIAPRQATDPAHEVTSEAAMSAMHQDLRKVSVASEPQGPAPATPPFPFLSRIVRELPPKQRGSLEAHLKSLTAMVHEMSEDARARSAQASTAVSDEANASARQVKEWTTMASNLASQGGQDARREADGYVASVQASMESLQKRNDALVAILRSSTSGDVSELSRRTADDCTTFASQLPHGYQG